MFIIRDLSYFMVTCSEAGTRRVRTRTKLHHTLGDILAVGTVGYTVLVGVVGTGLLTT